MELSQACVELLFGSIKVFDDTREALWTVANHSVAHLGQISAIAPDVVANRSGEGGPTTTTEWSSSTEVR